MTLESRYSNGNYLEENPDWHRSDSSWKADLCASILADNDVQPESVCEVGCGAGDVLVHLKKHLPSTSMTGYDFAPEVQVFWAEHREAGEDVEFHAGSLDQIGAGHYDVLMLLDVFEHVRDPFTLLEECQRHADAFVFHIPLDLSASSILRSNRLPEVREKVGHIHSYTKDLALLTLEDTGYEVIEWRYTGASLNLPKRSMKSRLAALPRRIAFAASKDFGVRLLGGETLLVFAKRRFADGDDRPA